MTLVCSIRYEYDSWPAKHSFSEIIHTCKWRCKYFLNLMVPRYLSFIRGFVSFSCHAKKMKPPPRNSWYSFCFIIIIITIIIVSIEGHANAPRRWARTWPKSVNSDWELCFFLFLFSSSVVFESDCLKFTKSSVNAPFVSDTINNQ